MKSAVDSVGEIAGKSAPKISVLVPVYNEAEVLPAFFARLQSALEPLQIGYEVICVNDGSSDNSLAVLESFAATDPRLKVVSFSRNFGKEAAMSAAIDYAGGDAAIPIDCDLQDPPELIGAMVEKWQAGSDVVVAKRISRSMDSSMKRVSAGLFYRVFNRISEVDIPMDVGDFRLMDRKVLDVLRALPEKDRFMKGLYCWPGFTHSTIEFHRQGRERGASKFNYWGLWNFALSGITSFSTFPIRFSVYLGLVIALVAFLFGFFIIFKTLLFGADTPGYASIMVVVLFLGGVQLFFLGLMGEYIGRIYKEIKNRPLYVVERTVGFGDD